jgi:hypothetical protein
VPLPQRFLRNRGRLAHYSMWGLLCCLAVAIFLPAVQGAGGSLGVDVIAEHQAGIYDVSVVRSDGAVELIDWLNRHNFKFGDADTAAFDSYISKGWFFVVAIVNPNMGEEDHHLVSEGLAAPLVVRFPHDRPVYPVALTGTGGFDTEILIYLAASTKMTTDNRLTLRFAGKMGEHILEELSLRIDPEGFFDPEKMNYPYLCKFRDTLTPDEMRLDISFSEAEDDEPYRKHIFRL